MFLCHTSLCHSAPYKMTALLPDCLLISVSSSRLFVRPAMITSRDTELAERLRQAAASGRTETVVELLEEGAPFIVDSVSIFQPVTALGQHRLSNSLEYNGTNR